MKKILSIIVFLACMLNLLHSQSLIDINASGTRALQAEVSDNPIIREMFKEADRYRTFNYNKQLVNIRSHNVGDTLLLSFFDDKQYKAVIQSVSITDEGRTAIASQVEGSAFAYCYIIVSENTITISAETPFEDEYFFASVKGGAAYIGQMRKSEMDKNAIEGSGPLMPPPVLNKGESNFVTPTRGEADPATVDLLYVYTPAAELWAANNTGQTDIHDLITISLQKANTVMQNSGTGITYNIAYKHLTNYVEDDSSIDLDRITNTNDGYMDEVHDLRNAFYADVIVFIPEVTFTGGVAWLLSNENGFAQDNYAVALSRVQQSSWTYTVVHEVGHNMGCGHHAEQNVQPGPGLHSYSSGWRGTISGRKECTVMTYESGSYFDDGQAHVRIPYFSSPDLQVEGVTIGSATENNALTLKKTKTAVAAYRTPPTTPTLTVSHNSLSFTDMPTQTLVVSGFHLTGNISYVFSDPGSFSVNTSSWDAAKGGILNLTFIGSALLNYEGTLTVSGGGVPSKVVNLKYTVCSTPIISIEESFDDNTFPPDCWTSESATGTPWKTVSIGTYPECTPHAGSTGMLQYNCYVYSAGNTGLLISPEIVSGEHDCKLTFWMYRDDEYLSYQDKVNVYLSTTKSINSLMPVLTIYRHRNLAPIESANDWYQYSLEIPTSSMSHAYVIFEGVSDWGNNIYLDDINIDIAPEPQIFEKITALSGLKDGYYVIANSASAYAMNNTNGGTFFGNTAITPVNDEIINPVSSIVWKIETNGSSKTIFNETTAKYVSYTGSSNEAYFTNPPSLTNAERWTFDYISNLFRVQSVNVSTRFLQYNSSSPRFACYTGTQQHLSLYRLRTTDPTLTTSPSSLPFGNVVIGATPSQEIIVSSENLTDTIKYEITGTGAAAFSVNKVAWVPASGGTLSVTFTPTATQVYNAILTLSSTGADPQTVTLSGTGVQLNTLYFDAGNGTPVPPMTELSYGAGVVLPNTTPSTLCLTAGYTFAGWATAAVEIETLIPPTLYAVGATYLLATNDTLHAVYKKTVGEDNYERVTSGLTDWTGDYLIAYSNSVIFNGSLTTIDAANNYVNPSTNLSGNTITKSWGDIYKFALEPVTGGYVLKSTSGYYVYNTGTSSGMQTTLIKTTAQGYPITINYVSSSDVRIHIQPATTPMDLRCNISSGYRFRYYTNAGQEAIYLYKLSNNAITSYNSTPSCAAPQLFCGGEGTQADPYLICTAQQLDSVRYFLNAHFKLMADIDLGVAPYNTGTGWNPIGTSATAFTGNFDGNGKVISNLFINRSADYQGLFGYAISATIKNVGIECDITGKDKVGGLAGHTFVSHIDNCYVKGVVSGAESVGGVVGYNDATTIRNCYTTTNVTATGENVGGLAGLSRSGSTIEYCYAAGAIEGLNFVGGIVGVNMGVAASYVRNCVAANSAITATVTSGIYVFRIGQSGSNSTFEFNWANDAMLVNGSEASADLGLGDKNGASYALVDMKKLIFFTTGVNWTGSVWDIYDSTPGVWDICEEETLPWLRWEDRCCPVNAQAPVITTQPQPATIEIGAPGSTHQLSVTATSPDGGTLTYQWYSAENPSAEGTLLTGETSPTYNAPKDVVGTYYYFVVVTNTIEDSGDCVGNLSYTTTSDIVAVTVFQRFCGGLGTQASPYLICTAEDLADLATWTNGGGDVTAGKYFKVTADIDLGVAPYNTGQGWTPIGTNTTGQEFKGNFDGGCNVIKNLTINRPADYQGLLGYSSIATIKNLGIENCDMTVNSFCGGLVGRAINTHINDCYVTGTMSAGSYAGGITGHIESGAINDCYTTCTISNNSGGWSQSYGGIAGRSFVTIKNCYATGAITGGDALGGIVGENNGTIQNCVAANNAITSTVYGGRVDRISSHTGGPAYWQNNYALTTMVVTAFGTIIYPIADLNGLSGEDATLQSLTDFNFYNNAVYGTWYDNIPWSICRDVQLCVSTVPTPIWHICDHVSLPVFQCRFAGSVCPYIITATAGTHGAISPTGFVAVDPDATQAFTITPDACYEIDVLTVDGTPTDDFSPAGGGWTYTFEDVRANHTIAVTFKLSESDTTKLARSICAGDSTEFFGQYLKTANTYYQHLPSSLGCDSVVTLNLTLLSEITPTFTGITTGYTLGDPIPPLPLTSDNGISGTWAPPINNMATTTYTFTPNTNECATTTQITITITGSYFVIIATAGANGTINPAGNINVLYGNSQGFTFMANVGYVVDKLYVDGINVPDSIPGGSYTFNNVIANHTITVIFKSTIATFCPEQVYDVANNIVYNVVELVGLCWTKENLRNRYYADNSAIPFAKPYYHTHNPDSVQNAANFGLLYDWYSAAKVSRATVQGICPDGWRLPTSAEFQSLNTYIIDDLRNPAYWLLPNNNTNIADMDARAAGYFNSALERFEDLYGSVIFWSSDAPTANTCTGACLRHNCNQIEPIEIKLDDAVSVRCVME